MISRKKNVYAIVFALWPDNQNGTPALWTDKFSNSDNNTHQSFLPRVKRCSKQYIQKVVYHISELHGVHPQVLQPPRCPCWALNQSPVVGSWALYHWATKHATVKANNNKTSYFKKMFVWTLYSFLVTIIACYFITLQLSKRCMWW